MSLKKRIPAPQARTHVKPSLRPAAAASAGNVTNIYPANRLLSALPRKDRDRLLGRCETVELHFADTLQRTGECVTHAYFPIDSLVSLVTPVDENAHLEVGLVGNEGLIGTSLALGVEESPWDSVVQGPGSALRISAAAFKEELAHSALLQNRINRYLCVLLSQLARTAACTRFHVVEARLARWLLMTQDRAQADNFHLTHEFLAFMLGVRRVGITRAAGALQERSLIRYSRGDIRILDREGLRAAACSCYGANNQTYERILAQVVA